MKKESKQLKLVKEITAKFRKKVEKGIIKWADTWGKDFESGNYDNGFYDASFDPWVEADPEGLSKKYEKMISYFGNENNETEFMNIIIIDVLKKKNPKKYASIITEFERINREGL